MLNIFKKKEQKFYKIETDNICGDAVFYMIGRMLCTATAKYAPGSGERGIITFLSTKTNKEILAQLKKTFGDTYNIKNEGMAILMTPKTVEAL